jgi:hypothetical protein
MPCYDPPYDAPNNHTRMGLEARERVDKYVAQLKEIEELCKTQIPADTMSGIGAELLAKRIIEMIHAPWRDS